MPNVSYPNQRLVKINREHATTDFLGIKNENWQAASRDLGAHALQLYLYFAANANNYTLALSPVAVRQAIGMARSTYHDQFNKLLDKGYLVPAQGNLYNFYETPKAAAQLQTKETRVGLEDQPPVDNPIPCGGDTVLAEDREINNIDIQTDNKINSEEIIQVPRVKEIVIASPKAESKIPARTNQPNKAVFEF